MHSPRPDVLSAEHAEANDHARGEETVDPLHDVRAADVDVISEHLEGWRIHMPSQNGRPVLATPLTPVFEMGLATRKRTESTACVIQSN